MMTFLKTKKYIFSLTAFVFVAFTLNAEISVKNNAKNDIATAGSPVEFTVQDCPKTASWSAKINGYKAAEGSLESGKASVLPKECGAVIFTAENAVEKNSPAAKKHLNGNGVLVSPEKILPANTPAEDADEFWNNAKKELSKYQLKFSLTKIRDEGLVELYGYVIDLGGGELGSANPVRASGYLAKPKGSKKLPAMLTVYGAGTFSANMRDAIKYAKLGALSVTLNPHPFFYNASADEIDSARNGVLKRYNQIGVKDGDPTQIYFYGMFKRLYAVLCAIESHPNFDKKHFVVRGFSQGGAQSIMAAYLSDKVTAICPAAPAMCDLGSVNKDRRSAWPFWVNDKRQSETNEISKYFDMALLGAKAKAEMFVAIGLLDETCSPSSIMAMYNNYGGKKSYMTMQNTPHDRTPEFFKQEHEFILKHLSLKK